jgi:hypothetical protein
MTIHLMTVDPDTSSAWDSAGVDALKFGVESRA